MITKRRWLGGGTACVLLSTVIWFCCGHAASLAQTASGPGHHVAITGNDADPGSEDRPWRTIQHAADHVAPGDTVIVHPGKYGEDVDLRKSGSEGKRIVFRASGKAVVKRFRIGDCDYITIDGFEMTDSDDRGHFMRFYGDHVHLLNNLIHDTNARWCVVIADGDNTLIKNNRYYTSQPTDGSDRVVFELAGANGVVEGNEIGPAIDIDAFRMFGHGHVFRKNYIHDVRCSGSGAHVDVFQTFGVGADREARDIVFENNRIVNFDGQLCMTENTEDPDFHDFDIRNNVFVGVSGQANLGIPNMRWYNNSFYDVGSGNRLVFSGSDNRPKGICNGLQIVNNLIISSRNVTDYGQVMGINRTGLTGVVIDYNFVARMQDFSPLTGFREEHGINGGDPQFADAAQKDFHLRATSPAIGKGTTLPRFNYDFDWIRRPAGSGWDIGAFEYTDVRAQTDAGDGPGEFREFKDQRGRALQARVLRVSGDEVTVERKDGRQFAVPVSAFSAADQEYLRAPAAGPAPVAVGADWPRFRGPHGNGLSDEKLELLADGPKKRWQVTVAGGRGSPVVVSGKVYVAGNDNHEMTVTCLDAEQGRELWTTLIKKDGGNNSTPTVADCRVYVLGYRGQAFCFDARTGEQRWEQDLRMPGGEEAGWGHAGSPLIWEDLVICNVGAGVAVKKETGEIVWQHVGHSGHATPVLFTLNGRTGVAIFCGTTLFARSPRSGTELWSIPWPTERTVNACDPIFVDDRVLISTEYGKGAALFDLSGAEPKQMWYEEKLGSAYRTGVYWKGCVYGNGRRKPACYDYATGQVHWEERRKEGGFALLADEKLIYLTGDGLLIIANPTPDGLTPIVEAQLLEGTTWGPPALCNGKLYVRNESGDLACWQIGAGK